MKVQNPTYKAPVQGAPVRSSWLLFPSLTRIVAPENQIVVLFRNGYALRILRPRARPYWFAGGGWSPLSIPHTLPFLSDDEPGFDALLEKSWFKPLVKEILELGPNERAVVREGARPRAILGPGRHARLGSARAFEIERHEVSARALLDAKDLDAILALPGAKEFLDPIDVPAASRCALWRAGKVVAFLGPGRYAAWKAEGDLARGNVAEAQPLLAESFTSVLDAPEASAHIEAVSLDANERAVLWADGKVAALLGPGRRAYWKVSDRLRLERFVADEIEFSHPRLSQIAAATGANALLQVHQVQPGQVGLLFVSGKFRRTLEPGRHAFWLGVEPFEVDVHDLRPRTVSLQGQELMTQDRVSLRLNFDMTVRTVDPLKARMGATKADDTLYNRAQLALREFVGARTLDQLLERKDALGEEVIREIAAAAEAVGHAVEFAGLRDVILPGELRAILNKVIEAKKRAEANVVKRREETASTRSLLNTARVIEENPIMMRLKEIEALQEMMEKVQNLTVFDGLRGLLDSVRLAAVTREGEGAAEVRVRPASGRPDSGDGDEATEGATGKGDSE